jgi:dolichyl-phosphate beta-glucosyltransferase
VKTIHLSLVIPAYNEEKRLPNTLQIIDNYFKKQFYTYEIIIVDGGSTDKTSEVVKNFQKQSPRFKLIRLCKNRGKGYHIRTGILNSSGKYIVFTDADCSTPIEEIEKLLFYLENGYDLVIGSRHLFKSAIVLPQNWIRRRMGKIYSSFTQIIGLKNIKDVPCGFKGFRREAAMKIFHRTKLAGFSFDAEVLYLAQRKFNYKIKEVPIKWKDSLGSKVKLWKDPILMTFDLMRIKFYDWMGYYD